MMETFHFSTEYENIVNEYKEELRMQRGMNKFCYSITNGSVKGDFNVYQATNGKIYLLMGKGYTPLTEQQVIDLGIDVYSLQEFKYELYKSAYAS